ncbi:MAG TPA: hypothetical protein VFY71_14590 [Planctomycetota bacterium]|nr:hypothetical protein [Planctomycetota bacterium]
MLAATLLLAAAAPALTAQWAVINLHPDGPFDSYALCIQDGHQAGYTRESGTFLQHAAVWSGTAGSWVDLHPPGATQSTATCVAGGQQAGWACCFDPPTPGSPVRHAMLWSGTAASWIDLSPPGMFGEATGSFGSQQAGVSYTPTEPRAGVWSGTAASWLDLHPAAADWSWAYDTDGVQQVGIAQVNGNTHASMWAGTAASWKDFHPSSALASRALAVQGGQQVGWASYPLVQHAHLWKGTKQSLVDLHPAGAAGSLALGVHGDQQVGWVLMPTGGQRASLWSGTAASWVDLDALLAPEYSLSEAHDIWHFGNSTYVVGYAFNTAAGHYDALMWVSPPVWTDLGSPLPGASGAPKLSGEGLLVPGLPMSLSLAGAAPSALALLFVALSSTPAPFKGGTLVPLPPVATLPMSTSAAGKLQIGVAEWPAGASGFGVHLQFAIQDAGAVHGVALSNALRADVP